MKKSILSLFLSAVMLLSVLPTSAGAIEEQEALVTYEATVDADVAATIAMLFVLANLENTVWDMTTDISSLVPLYDNNEVINAYCVNLETEKGLAGYVIVSADLNKSLIQEYSDTATALVDVTGSDDSIIYYYGPMEYGIKKNDTETSYSIASYDDEGNNSNEEAVRFINMLRTTGLISASNVSAKNIAIEDPLVYLAEKYPGAIIINNDYYNIGDTSIYPYKIVERNACTVYATAAIVHYYIYWYSYEEIVTTCLRLARERGYATETDGIWNYYIKLGSTEDFMQTCLDYYECYATANSNLFAYVVARNEISNNRPVLLNIGFSEQCDDHTVTAFAWTNFTISGYSDSETFFKVKDGYAATNRYICWSTVVGAFTTKVS